MPELSGVLFSLSFVSVLFTNNSQKEVDKSINRQYNDERSISERIENDKKI